MGTKENPGPYDCYADADTKEPIFHLLGRDRMGPSLVDLWADAREAEGEDAAVVRDARDVASEMRNWLYLQRRSETRILELVPFQRLEAELQRRLVKIHQEMHQEQVFAKAPDFEPSGPIELDSPLAPSKRAKGLNGHTVHHDVIDGVDSEGGEP